MDVKRSVLGMLHPPFSFLYIRWTNAPKARFFARQTETGEVSAPSRYDLIVLLKKNKKLYGAMCYNFLIIRHFLCLYVCSFEQD